jgi:cytochrome c oxidase subunit IV
MALSKPNPSWHRIHFSYFITIPPLIKFSLVAVVYTEERLLIVLVHRLSFAHAYRRFNFLS